MSTGAQSLTRKQILSAALKHFAHSGYAATSVQQIVSDARVSKPALYYHFKDKAGLFQALVDEAHDERYRLMRAAAEDSRELRTQLVAIVASLFDYLKKNRELMRIAFATAFAAPGELPKGLSYLEKCERNFEFIHSLMKRAAKAGVLNRRFTPRDLANAFYGQLNSCLASHLLMPDSPLNRAAAARMVDLFLTGAAAKKRAG
ncbi:MAG TPA: TetR/AcrR family transcriptional regulator [Verrucomicrobia bacterium]|nr:TetR/AcrR family transcriptional regulator [Verrucomicrobiota bacterium]HOP96741.1 TetR/AcrR family transcriptional regulator [Verrucomicrobiota bacterium]HPU55364.1 TetR/AcrR family transcriptional regulator [Verrucomicrobiota bacterium]